MEMTNGRQKFYHFSSHLILDCTYSLRATLYTQNFLSLRQTRQDARQFLHDILLLRRSNIHLGICIADRDTDIAARMIKNSLLSWQPASVSARLNISATRLARIHDPREHELEVAALRSSIGTSRGIRSREIDVDESACWHVSTTDTAVCEGPGDTGGQLAIHFGVMRHWGDVPCRLAARLAGERNGRIAFLRRFGGSADCAGKQYGRSSVVLERQSISWKFRLACHSLPTFGPATAILIGLFLKNLGASVVMPYRMDVTGKELT